FASARTSDHRYDSSARPSGFVTATGVPPVAATRNNPSSCENTIVSSGSHVAPHVLVLLLPRRTVDTRHTVIAAPPPTGTLFSALPVKNPIDCPSAEKKGWVPRSAPLIFTASI